MFTAVFAILLLVAGIGDAIANRNQQQNECWRETFANIDALRRQR